MVRGIRRRHLLQEVGSFDKFQTSFCPSLRNNNKTLQNIDVIVSYKYNFLSSQEKLFFFHFIINKKKNVSKNRIQYLYITYYTYIILFIFNCLNIISFLRKKNFFLIKKNHTEQSNIIFLHATYYTYNFIYFLYYQRIFPIYLRTSKSFKFPNIQKKKDFPPENLKFK